LHQKLVLSQYASSCPSSKLSKSLSSAIKLDMDDRAKMIQYFASLEGNSKEMSVKIEDILPRPGPSVPTIITVQAPAGIGKSSMLKYMCMKWGCQELWNSNFDVIAFVECRTLNRLGHLTGKEFLRKILLDPGFEAFLEELALKAATGRVLLLLDGLDEVHGVAHLNNIPLGTTVHNGRNGTKEISSNRKHSHYYYDVKLSPLEFTQLLLTGSILGGCHVIVTHLQASKWFLSLQKRLVSLDIQGLSDEGVQSFIHRYINSKKYLRLQ
ncbi:Putative LOC101236297, partial [Caligus rogercresseyi]